MAGVLRDFGGGIVSLIELIDEHSGAIEYDLITLGLRLRDVPSERLNWRDLLVIVRQSPKGSALRAATDPAYLRSPELELLRAVAFYTNVVAWQRTEDGQKGRRVPEWPRFPWDPKPVDEFGMDVMDKREMARLLGWPVN